MSYNGALILVFCTFAGVFSQQARADVHLVIPSIGRSIAIACDEDKGATMVAPIPGRGEVDLDHAIALIVEIESAEPKIVSGISEVYRDQLSVRVQLPKGGAILNGLISDKPMRILRLHAGYVVPSQNAGHAISRLVRSCQKSAVKPANAPPGSYWMQGGSVMRLEASKTSRKFIVYRPSKALATLSVKPGSLRFTGRISGKSYIGSAVLFTEQCGHVSYRVTGQIENHDERVVLKGQAPQLDNRCKEIGKREMTLTFEYMKQPP